MGWRSSNNDDTAATPPRRPWAAVPAARSSAARLKTKQRIIIGATVAAALTGPAALGVALTAKPAPPPVQQTADVPTWVVSFAQAVASDYAAGRATELPVAKGVDPKFGFDPAQPGKTPPHLSVRSLTHFYSRQSTVGNVPVVVSTFRADTDQGVYDISVTTVTDNASGLTVLAATPTLTRAKLAADDAASAPDWKGTQGAVDSGFPQSLQTVLNKWATAYAADDRPTLRLIVGGGPEGGDYLGLGGWKTTGQVRLLAALPSADGSGNALVRARVGFASDSANGFHPESEYDLLVANYGSADPKVLAWGPAGSGSQLKPYQNNTAFR